MPRRFMRLVAGGTGSPVGQITDGVSMVCDGRRVVVVTIETSGTDAAGGGVDGVVRRAVAAGATGADAV